MSWDEPSDDEYLKEDPTVLTPKVPEPPSPPPSKPEEAKPKPEPERIKKVVRFRAGDDQSKWPRTTVAEMATKCEQILNEDKTWLGRRDVAILSILAAFGKRASEVIRLKKKDVYVEKVGEAEPELCIRFMIGKTGGKVLQRCASCKALNGTRAIFCSSCGDQLTDATPVIKEKAESDYLKTKKIPMSHPLAKFITQWVDDVPFGSDKDKISPPECYLFTPSDSRGTLAKEDPEDPHWGKAMNRRSVQRILHRHGLGHLWSHLFRHELASEYSRQLLKDGVDPKPFLKQWFDWTDGSAQPEHYSRLSEPERMSDAGKYMATRLFKKDKKVQPRPQEEQKEEPKEETPD